MVAPSIDPLPPVARLLCDEMLGGLARWLRAAGHDVAMAEPGAPDERLIARCLTEGRVLISRDQRLIARAPPSAAVLLRHDDLDGQAVALARVLDLDWRAAPFTRCMVDNTLLRPATEAEIAGMPASSRAGPGPFRACPLCGRLFWPGSHVKRMIDRLQRWAAAADAGNPGRTAPTRLT